MLLPIWQKIWPPCIQCNINNNQQGGSSMAAKKTVEIRTEQKGEKLFIMKDFVQTPQDVIRGKQKVTFAERWSRRCGNP